MSEEGGATHNAYSEDLTDCGQSLKGHTPAALAEDGEAPRCRSCRRVAKYHRAKK